MSGQFSSVHNILLIEAPNFKSPLHLTDGLYTVGRHPSNTIVISSPKLSRKHAYFYRKSSPIDSKVLYCLVDGDLQGHRRTDGLWVNGKQYQQQDYLRLITNFLLFSFVDLLPIAQPEIFL